MPGAIKNPKPLRPALHQVVGTDQHALPCRDGPKGGGLVPGPKGKPSFFVSTTHSSHRNL